MTRLKDRTIIMTLYRVYPLMIPFLGNCSYSFYYILLLLCLAVGYKYNWQLSASGMHDHGSYYIQCCHGNTTYYVLRTLMCS